MHSRYGVLVVLIVGAAVIRTGDPHAGHPTTGTCPTGRHRAGSTHTAFNGKDLSGWKPDVPAKDKDPAAPDSFIVRDGMLVSLGEPRGHLLTERLP